MTVSFADELNEHIQVMEMLHELEPVVAQAGQALIDALNKGGKVLLMGNGGSAADAQHIAAEIVGRFVNTRKGLPAIALTTDTSILTAVSNDFGYETVFSRQIEALGKPEDIILAYSTSGNSGNICAAIDTAKTIGCYTIGLTGESGGKMKERTDCCICIPSTSTQRIQEAHAFIGHQLCAVVDEAFTP